ncbi:MAG: MBL fold metallo-hydrolase [Saprospiraceae bacterium]
MIVLGIAQDGGYPHTGCLKQCCEKVYSKERKREKVCALGIIDYDQHQLFMLDATPDYPAQWKALQDVSGFTEKKVPDGIFLTHAHIGHYTGLMFLGREVLGARNAPVYCMPRMRDFLRNNGPWSQLVDLNNIEIRNIQADSTLVLNPNLRITPIRVPHRDEFSETVGFQVQTANKSLLFIPDIDKWEKWDRSLQTVLKTTDYAFLDATFYQDGELPGRSMAEVPHPFVAETMQLLEGQINSKVYFIHLNHTNPLLWDDAKASQLETSGFKVCREGMRFEL